jgi:hypothetical protein
VSLRQANTREGFHIETRENVVNKNDIGTNNNMKKVSRSATYQEEPSETFEIL